MSGGHQAPSPKLTFTKPYNMKKFLFAFITIQAFMSTAQQPTYMPLDHNNVSCLLDDEGGFFNNLQSGLAGYEIPKNSGLKTIFAGSYWIGAQDVNGNLYMSAAKYSAGGSWSAFHGGPIADASAYGTMAYANAYGDAIWKVSKQEILTHQANFQSPGYLVPTAIASWPGNGQANLGIAPILAPFIDLNHNGLYEPALGDYPDIRGDEAVYIIMNDNSYQPDGNQLGIELHAMFYQYSTGNYLNNTTFLNLRAINRSNKDYYNYRQALFLDFDIGNYSDDHVGCDPSNRLLYAYNGDDIDESDGGQIGYGANPPCQGVLCLSHPLESAGRLTGSMDAGMNTSFDTTAWLLMNGQNSDSSYWMNPLTNTATQFLYDGNPNLPNTWSEVSSNNSPGDRRGMLCISEALFPQNSTVCSDYAFVYDRSGDRLNNVQQVINISGALLNSYQSGGNYPCLSTAFNDLTDETLLPNQLVVHPNPSHGKIHLTWNNIQAEHLEIRTMHGALVYAESIENMSATDIDISELPRGIYFIQIGTHMQRVILD
jgi:hypothetical protein